MLTLIQHLLGNPVNLANHVGVLKDHEWYTFYLPLTDVRISSIAKSNYLELLYVFKELGLLKKSLSEASIQFWKTKS